MPTWGEYSAQCGLGVSEVCHGVPNVTDALAARAVNTVYNLRGGDTRSLTTPRLALNLVSQATGIDAMVTGLSGDDLGQARGQAVALESGFDRAGLFAQGLSAYTGTVSGVAGPAVDALNTGIVRVALSETRAATAIPGPLLRSAFAATGGRILSGAGTLAAAPLRAPAAGAFRFYNAAGQAFDPGGPVVVLPSRQRVGGLPAYLLERFEQGRAFDQAQAARYPFNEVYVESASSPYPLRLDSYSPAAREIVFRRFTQLSSVQEQTAINYINEAVAKYSPGTRIAGVPSNQRLLPLGEKLQGRIYFEVPVQSRPIPPSILDFASQKKVYIRDVNGTIYNP